MIEGKLKHRYVSGSVVFVNAVLANATETPQAVAQTPTSLDCVDVDLPNAVFVSILDPRRGVIDRFPGSGFLFVFKP